MPEIWPHALHHDVKLAFRQMRRYPTFAGLAIAILALGIGANTSIFSIAHSVLLKPLPYAEPDQLVQLWPSTWVNKRVWSRVSAQSTSYDGVTAFATWTLPMTGGGQPEAVVSGRVTPGHFEVLGARPDLGRTFHSEDSRPGSHRVAMLSHSLWRTRFGADSDVVGRRIELDGESYEVVGVMPESHVPLDPAWRLWTPLTLDPTDVDDLDGSYYLGMVARLRSDVSLSRADEELKQLAGALVAEFPQRFTKDRQAAAEVVSLHAQRVADARSTLFLLLAAVGTILLVACANLANLLLARAAGRRRELAVRSALGAGWTRIFRQLMVESLVLATVGGACGLLIALWGFEALRAQLPADMPRLSEVGLHGDVLLFTLAASLFSALLFGLAPAWSSAVRGRNGSSSNLTSGRRITGRGPLQSVLVVGQVAISLALLSVAGLLSQSLMRLQAVDPGFRTEQMVTFRPMPSQDRYPSHGSVVDFYDRVTERLESIPAVRGVAGIHLLPLADGNWHFPYSYEGQELPADPNSGIPLPAANFRVITPGYFELMEIPVIEGRAIDEMDGAALAASSSDAVGSGAAPPGQREDAEPYRVGWINRTLASELWPGQRATGKKIQLFGNQTFEVAGVVADVHQHALAQAPTPEMYWPLRQAGDFGARSLALVLRTDGPTLELANTLRQAVWSVDPNIPIVEMKSMPEVKSAGVAGPRLRAFLLSSFAGLALILGMVGIYGVVSYSVSARTAEIGVRMALGARRSTVLRDVLREGLRLAVVGLALGLLALASLRGRLEQHLFAIEAGHFSTHAVACLTLLCAVLVACWWPARRASEVEPSTALRHGEGFR